MPKKGPWKPPTYVGPPGGRDDNAEEIQFRPRDNAPSTPRRNPNTRCPTCFDLDLRYIPQPHKDPNLCSYGQVARHWISASDLAAQSAECASCRFLKSAFDTLLGSDSVLTNEKASGRGGDYRYQIAILDRDDDDAADEVGKQRKKQAASNVGASRSLLAVMRCSSGSKRDQFDEEFDVEIYTPPGAAPAPWKSIGMAGEVPTTLTADECAAVIRPWVQDCDMNHPLCKSNYADHQGNRLPKRVLDVSRGKVRLVETATNQRGSYVALSHCWGKAQLLTTTRETIAQRMRDIPLEQMPKTFQDAVGITRALGLQYIWIDSLCIIQQDKKDWEQQSAVMADIYAQCYLNIATTRAGGGHEGCLGARWTMRNSLDWADEFSRAVSLGENKERVSRMRKCEVKSFRVPDAPQGQDIHIRLQMKSSHEALQTPRWIRMHSDTAPLLPRAWVYQERSLAARTVHLHANEMVWVCEVIQRCECKNLDGNPPDGDGYSASKDRIVTLGKLHDKKALHGLWRTIVEDFSLLDLTYESDRLPALSGLAYRFAEYLPRNERYLAGLWEGDLARSLLWESGGSEQTAGPTRKRDPKLATAPSWSWSSLVWGGDSAAGINWEYETKPKLASFGGVKSYIQDPRTLIISVSVNVDGENKYGIVRGGRLVIQGALCAIVLGTWNPRLALPGVMAFGHDEFNSLHLNYDTPTAEASAGGVVYCLFIGSFSEVFDHDTHPHVQHQGLILKPTANAFERIGQWSQHIEHWVYNEDAWTKKAGVVTLEIF